MLMAKPSEHPGFRALQMEWYLRLSQSGFRDIECSQGDRPLKKSGTERRYERMDPVEREARIQYFRRVQQHVVETKFETQLEHDIMHLYAQGVSQVMIQQVLGLDGHRCKVYYPIYRWLTQWGLK